MKAKKIVEYLLLFVLAGALLFFSFKEVKWSDFAAGIKSCNFYWIAASMAVGVLGFIVRACRWRLLLKPMDENVSFKQAFNGVSIAYLTNFAFPRAGELARCAVVAKEKKITFEGAVGTVVVERGIDLICLIFWVIVTMLIKWDLFGNFIIKELIEPFSSKFTGNVVAVMAVILCIAIISALVMYKLRRTLTKNRFTAKIVQIFKGLMNGIVSLFKMKEKWMFILYTFLIWGTYWATSYTTICAFPSVGHLGAADALFLMIVGGLGWVVPVQGGIGAFHFIVSLALAAVYGIPQSTGVVFATISHEAQALAMIICGVTALLSFWKVHGKTAGEANRE